MPGGDGYGMFYRLATSLQLSLLKIFIFQETHEHPNIVMYTRLKFT